jgi:kinesin family protein C1
LEKDGLQYDMQVSFVEIYNETIRDLLREEEISDFKHEIKVNPDGRRYITDINMVSLEPTDNEAVEGVMRQAAKHRSVGSTDMNAVSSRSHSVFTLHLTALNPTTRQALRGTLNLCDLAGSERLDRSKATGARAKEAMAINKSLSSLTDVFVSIGKKASHIPFRNSKLTWLLQPSLSGDGKTLMVVNMSPTEQSTQETLCSLRFAAQVNKCELGKAKRSLEEVDDEDAASISSSMSGSASRQSGKKGGAMKSPVGRSARPGAGAGSGRNKVPPRRTR